MFFQSFLHGKQFAATLKSEKKGINTCVAYLIIDENGIILEASSSNFIKALTQFIN
jgi:branched-subunit amino acid aminotransferase/4-amino-4-deoxychorismate lyase